MDAGKAARARHDLKREQLLAMPPFEIWLPISVYSMNHAQIIYLSIDS